MATSSTSSTPKPKTSTAAADGADDTTSESAASVVRRESQAQTDQVAMVSRTATGEPHQHPGYEIIGVPDDATEAEKAAAENRPER